MAFCSQCGNSVTADMRFCPGCGAQLNAAEAAPLSAQVNPNYAYNASVPLEYGDFKVILLSAGSCALADGLALLEYILGYTSTKARSILRAAPTAIAQNLTLTQAQYIAQALTEYGMEVSITNAAGTYIDACDAAGASVFDSTGDFLPAIAGALAMLGVANRIDRITHWEPIGPRPPLFRLGFRRPAPRLHFRRSMPHQPPVQPPMRKAARPPMPARPAPRPARGFGMGGPHPSAGPGRPSGGPGHPSGGRSPRGGGFGGGFGGRR